MKVCPKCTNEMSEGLFEKDKKCFFCDNTDFSDEAMKLLDYEYNKVNCTACGALVKIIDVYTYSPMFYKFSRPLEPTPLGWVRLCRKCDLIIDTVPDRDWLNKFIKGNFGLSSKEVGVCM